MDNKYNLDIKILIKDDINTDDKVFVVKEKNNFLATGVFTEYKESIALNILEIDNKFDELECFLLDQITSHIYKIYNKTITLGIRAMEHKLIISALKLGYKLYSMYSITQLKIGNDTVVFLKYDPNDSNDYKLPYYIAEEIKRNILNIQKMFKDGDVSE